MSKSQKVEDAIVEIVEEYLSKKPFSDIQEIVVFINNRMKGNPNVNRNRIELVIKQLIKKRRIIPGTKLMKKNITENDTREEILTYIKENPGKNINQIMRHHDLGSSLALWHLSCLEKFQFIRSKKMGNRKIFFQFNSDPQYDKLHYYMNRDIVQEIIQFIKAQEKGPKITDIANGLKKNHNTVKKYLKILEDLDLVHIKKDNSRDIYILNKKAHKKALKRIA